MAQAIFATCSTNKSYCFVTADSYHS